MRNITEYIIESSEFSNTSMAQEILDDKHIEYKLDKNPNNNYIRIDNSNISVSIRIKNKHSNEFLVRFIHHLVLMMLI